MIDLEKYWIAKEEIITTKYPDINYWDEMNKNGWKLVTSQGHLYSFHVYIWESERFKHHNLLETCEDDVSEYFFVPDRLQFFIRLWMNTGIPSNKTKRDCLDGKWQWQINRGWFRNPHLCKTICNQCEEFWKKKIIEEI